MSVFKKLKGTFQSAQQDIVDGLRSLTVLDSQPRHEQLRNIKTREINLDAGADLLYSYQATWSAMQTDTKESAKKAEEVSNLLNPLFLQWDKCGESISQLEQEVKAIPNILETLSQLQTLLETLRQDFVVAEKGLDLLENLCEEQDFRSKLMNEHKKLAVYKLQKEAEAEKVKVEMARIHAKKMAKLEAEKKINLQERAEAFKTAFQEDLEYYRAHGHPDRVHSEFPKVSSLSEIVIEDDKVELDSFLGPSGEVDDAPGQLELSGENPYIEDDYTTDFSIKQDAEFIDDVQYINATLLEEITIVEGEDVDEEYDGDSIAKHLQATDYLENLGIRTESLSDDLPDTHDSIKMAENLGETNSHHEDIKTSPASSVSHEVEKAEIDVPHNEEKQTDEGES
ncbi:dysbindin-A-like [Physella acuta]|uniref:dysbindin-A-like n=1 Tax=Physella acuta TaxID=109671 RepID=UPI0027DCD58F|nr:dysbindin-A-like [Physella acuta]